MTPETAADIKTLAETWSRSWSSLKDMGMAAPHVLGQKLQELHRIERDLARAARSRTMTLPEIAIVTEIEMKILMEELKSPILARAI